MSSPLVDPNFAGPVYFGDTADDDPGVLDTLVQSTDAPAKPVTEPIDATPLETPKPVGRLFTGTLSLTTDYVQPVQLLPADPYRKGLNISVFSAATEPAAAVEFVTIADENGKTGTSGAYRLRHGKDPLTLAAYTGAIWALPSPTITAAIEITWVAETV